ncbi:hypothetical protein GCM10008959_41210 [Deinococcus seoulensis]|uniref:Uncharacterized protein n=1 Tax=Deinococcus seoulensis TaxID=1837379 RepID=A0ABQ2RWY8_9DEIO|nr:hypothetical protein [Deinococcus seoulensis]GGR76101.1 hypothetical protein GCM10008959_41210 [Deinococcus seoulensis]
MPLTDTQLDRVKFLVQEDSWVVWEALLPAAERAANLSQALEVHGDLRLVAGYVLDRLAARAGQLAAQALEEAAAVSAVKVGRIEAKLNGEAAGEAERNRAAAWSERARSLKAEVHREAQARAQGGSVSLDVDVRF